MKIIGLFPLTGNGGIASWTKKFLATFPNDQYVFKTVDVTSEGGGSGGKFIRSVRGLRANRRILSELRHLIKMEHFDILHTTTSGDLGSLRDYMVGRLCHKRGIKTIMHCRYGCITEKVQSSGIIGMLTRRAMKTFDQIWVLDSRSYNTLKGIDWSKGKVYLTPNSIDVTEPINPEAKEYRKIAFCGNLIPTKGLFELIDAVMSVEAELHIIGPGSVEGIQRIRNLAGDLLDRRIFIHGKLPNAEAIQLLKTVDIVALPTYFPNEAFPISILEAMSLTKMVISCPRAAIKDMLTDIDGNPCGILVEPKSSVAVADAIKWCQSHKEEADVMCQKAYEKVYTAYRKEVVYDIYRRNYKKLLEQ